MSKSASVGVGRGVIVVNSEAQRQAPRGRENETEMQIGGEGAQRQALGDEAMGRGSGEESRG